MCALEKNMYLKYSRRRQDVCYGMIGCEDIHWDTSVASTRELKK